LSITKQPAIARAFYCLLFACIVNTSYSYFVGGLVDLLTKVFIMNTRLLKELQKHQTNRPIIDRKKFEQQYVPAYIEGFTITLCILIIIAGITWGAL
jgi:hypothetical protein